MNLRPYQLTAVESTEKAFGENKKLLGVLPTGGGKTIIFSHLAKRRADAGQRTLILAHREELIDQAIQKLYASTGIAADKEKAEERARLSATVTVASIQTLMRESRLQRWPRNHFSLCVIDEAHHALAESYQTVLKHFDADILGVTATPDRGDKRQLGSYFESIAFEVSLFDLIEQGYLSRITVKAVPLQIDLSQVSSIAGDFKESDLGHAIEPYLDDIAKAIKEHAAWRRTLVFLPLIQTSLKFAESCANIGLRARHIDGNSTDRKEILEEFAGYSFDVLSNAMLLTEGYDDPGIDCVCVLRPTRSRPLFAQMVGRGTRIHPFKDNLLLLDFLWHHQKHRLCRPASLVATTEEETDRITEMSQGIGVPPELEQEELDLGKLATAAMHEREKRLLAKIAENKDKAGKFISADQFAAEHDSIALADYEPVMPWESTPVSEKQAKYLKRAGIDLDTVKGKGHAHKLLGIYFATNRPELATPRQRSVMRRKGYPNWDTATKADARKFFAGMRDDAA